MNPILLIKGAKWLINKAQSDAKVNMSGDAGIKFDSEPIASVQPEVTPKAKGLVKEPLVAALKVGAGSYVGLEVLNEGNFGRQVIRGAELAAETGSDICKYAGESLSGIAPLMNTVADSISSANPEYLALAVPVMLIASGVRDLMKAGSNKEAQQIPAPHGPDI